MYIHNPQNIHTIHTVCNNMKSYCLKMIYSQRDIILAEINPIVIRLLAFESLDSG